MINVKKFLKDFYSLSKDEKIRKLKSMLEVVKEEGNVFDDIYQLLEIDSDIDDDIINMIYEAMVRAMYSLQVEDIEKQIDKMEKIKEKLNRMLKKEKREKGEIEKILDTL